ncbi:hypothetical protein ACF09L_08500 [Streptomyces sp. NPDC014779]|uniref:hypothetical protein n=1 Tax=unclassified Streptomyces TaxID=2593676 RepID=UPI00370121EA
MQVKDVLCQIFRDRVSEYFSMSPVGFTPAPALYDPAPASARAELEERLGAVWDDGYREFLEASDGMNGFNLAFLGVKDWSPGGLGEAASRLLEDFRDIGLPEDEGIDPGVELAPVAVNSDISVAVFMGDMGAGSRFWLVGEGDGFFLESFVDVLRFVGGERRVETR